MKKKSIISLLICCLTLGFATTSCEDMLSSDSERHSYEVAQDTLYSYWGILKSMQNVAERYVILGECRGELVGQTSYISDSIKAIVDFDMANAKDGSNRYLKASDYYHVINSCNAYMAMCDTARVTGTLQPYMMKEYAQVEAIRAWTYLQLVQVYKKVPFYTEPLTTTDKIDAFMSNPNKVMADADNLVTLLAPGLEKALQVENLYGFPQYEKYGFTTTVCHATKWFIPVNLILGDLYLLKGDQQSCRKAAECYYNYLGNTQGTGKITAGGTLPNGYNYIGLKGEGQDKPLYFAFGGGIPWTETGEVSRAREAITTIPSSTNKLWGTVLRGVNEVFGFASEISVRTGEEDSVQTASVVLTPQYDKKQLTASQAYFDLCEAQNYELYIGAATNDLSDYTLTVDPLVGDARQYWVCDLRQTYSNGVSNTEKFITKQNPNGGFTTTYPMIYRKSMIWLRYAEALNRAGYPSFAFAILKNGLCNNDTWYPNTSLVNPEYAVHDTAYFYNEIRDDNGVADTINFPVYDETIEGGSPYRTKAELIAALVEQGIADDEASVDNANISWDAISLENYPDENNCKAILNYLDLREVKEAPSFLNFSFSTFNGAIGSQSILYRTSLTSRGYSQKGYAVDGDDNATVGIHSRGCGILKYDERNSTYNYVDKVAEKAAEYGYPNLTKEQIYSGDYDDVVMNAVEDLIVDEEALELAFEGTRFFDLMRVAHRRNSPKYLADRLAKRNPVLGTKLLNEDNWYFPLPVE